MNNKFFLGINLTRALVGDEELHMSYLTSNKYNFGASIGYDFNFIDYLSSATESKESDSEEAQTYKIERYFQGRGFAVRINADYRFNTKKYSERFCSIEIMLKQRNFRNKIFREFPINFSESAKQTIYGVSILFGKNKQSTGKSYYKFYYGIGCRILNSLITRKGYTYVNVHIPDRKIKYNVAFPVLNLGFEYMFGK